jgi:hypothetical protein
MSGAGGRLLTQGGLFADLPLMDEFSNQALELGSVMQRRE